MTEHSSPEHPTSPENGTAAFVMNQEDAEAYLASLEAYPLSKRICICGHTEKSHRFIPNRGNYLCEPGNVWCHCKKPHVVYFASDARCFSRATHGVGMKHALGLGIADLHRKKKEGKWLIPLICWATDCGATEVYVACITKDGFVSKTSMENSALLCHKHLIQLGGSLLLD